MSKYTVDQIADAAEGASFYVTPHGTWLRVLYTERSEGMFFTVNEDTDVEHEFHFDELVDEDVHFEHLVRTVL